MQEGVTPPEFVKIIKGEGMPHHEFQSDKGDLYVKFKIAFPKNLTPQQQEGEAPKAHTGSRTHHDAFLHTNAHRLFVVVVSFLLLYTTISVQPFALCSRVRASKRRRSKARRAALWSLLFVFATPDVDGRAFRASSYTQESIAHIIE